MGLGSYHPLLIYVKMNGILLITLSYLFIYLWRVSYLIGFIKSISNTFYMLKEKYGVKGTIPYFIQLALPAMTLTYSGYVFENCIMIASGLFIFSVETFAAFKSDKVNIGHYVGALVGYGAMVVSFIFLHSFWWWAIVCGLGAVSTIFVPKKYKTIYIEVILYVLGIVGLLIYNNFIL